MSFPVTLVKEGAASFLVPELKPSEVKYIDRARSRAPVFYNPRMSLNRDSAVLALGAYQKSLSRHISACEPMCGTGIRGIRLALEVDGVEHVVLGDLNPLAAQLAKENAYMNDVSDKVRVRRIDANLLLSLHARPLHRFDYVDIDPYGSPVPFLDGAVRSCRRNGLIGLTATDMAPLCGVNPRACLRKYGGRPIRTMYCLEVALRLVAGALVTTAARYEVAARPLFSYAADHYVRLYAKLEKGAKNGDQCLEGMGYLLHCFGCSNWKTVPNWVVIDSLECEVCGAQMKVAGPMWLGDLAEEFFCDDMTRLSERSAVSSNRRLMNIIRLVKGEIGFPRGYYNIDKLCSKLRIPSMATGLVTSSLREAGFRTAETHFDRRGVKTDASILELEKLLRDVALNVRRLDDVT